MPEDRIDFALDDIHVTAQTDPPTVWLMFGDKPQMDFARVVPPQQAEALSVYLHRAVAFAEPAEEEA